MRPLQINIGDKLYEYVNDVTIDNKNYLAFTDFKNVYIKEYKNNLEELELFDIDDATFEKVKEEMNL